MRCYGDGLSSFHLLLYIDSFYQIFVFFFSLSYMHSGFYEPRQRTPSIRSSRQAVFILLVWSTILSTHSSLLCIFLYQQPRWSTLHIFVTTLQPSFSYTITTREFLVTISLRPSSYGSRRNGQSIEVVEVHETNREHYNNTLNTSSSCHNH